MVPISFLLTEVASPAALPQVPTPIWITFTAFVVVLLLFDTVLAARKDEDIPFGQAILRTLGWVSIGMAFNAWMIQFRGWSAGQEFFACYLLEESLSVDNLFVFMVILSYFKVPPGSVTHRVLFFGVLGAILMRGTLIIAGIELVERFHSLLYIFAIILIVSGIKMGGDDDDAVDPSKNFLIRLVRRWFPVTEDYHGNRFFIREEGLLKATPLFVVLVCVETTDLLFAVDSIPAVFGVTADHFVAFTSNIMAVLGLRALFFAVSGLMKYFRYLPTGLKIILVLIGVKMLVHEVLPIATTWLLAMVATVLAISVFASVMWPEVAEVPPEECTTHEATE